MLLFLWSVANRELNCIVRVPTKPDISCEWNTIFSIIPEIPINRVHSKRIPKFSKTFPGIFTVPFNFEPEISEFLVEWKAPRVYVGICHPIFGKPLDCFLTLTRRGTLQLRYTARLFINYMPLTATQHHWFGEKLALVCCLVQIHKQYGVRC